MSTELLKDGWVGIGWNPSARGVFMIVIGGAGPTYYLATETINMRDASGKEVLFVDAILNDQSFTETIDVFSKSYSADEMMFTVDLDSFPAHLLRRQGILLELLTVDVYWSVVGLEEEHDVAQAFRLLSGTVAEPAIDVSNGTVTFRVEDKIVEMLENDLPFPPVIADTTKLANINSEDHGKPYSVVFGTATKVPVIENSAGAGTNFVALIDRIGDVLDPISAMFVGDGSDIYAGAGALQSAAEDLAGNLIWGMQPNTAAGSDRNVTANITGHKSETPGDIVRDLIMFYSANSKNIDLTSISRLRLAFNNVTMAVAFDSIVEGGVVSAIRDRIASQVPFVVAQRGGKIEFIPLTWDRHITKRLTRNQNIIRTISPPKETSKRRVRNAFVFNFDRSGFRGDAQGSVGRDATNDYDCFKSRDMVGERPEPPIDVGDLKGIGSALVVARWYVETFAKVRTAIGYECTMDVVDVHMWDTVTVDDLDEGWDHRPLFKVVGKTLTSGGTIVLSLLSVDDYIETYNVNRYKSAVGDPWPEPVPLVNDTPWGDGVPGATSGDGWGDGGPGWED